MAPPKRRQNPQGERATLWFFLGGKLPLDFDEDEGELMAKAGEVDARNHLLVLP